MTEEIRECYRLLEIEPGATPEAVRQAYRDLIKIWHPDRFPEDPKFQRRATEKTKEINDAYQKMRAFMSGSYTESRSSARQREEEAARRTRQAQEEARARQQAEEKRRQAWEEEQTRQRAREAAEAQARYEAAEKARQAEAARAWEEARLREAARRQAEREGQIRPQTPPPISPPRPIYAGIPASPPQQPPPKKKRDPWEFVGLALVMLWFAFGKPACDRESQLSKTKSAAEAGDAPAQRRLGQHYEEQQNYTEAANQYLKAASQGDTWAQAQIGWMYHNGRGVPQNYQEAIRWYSAAAESGDATAQNNVGIMYQNGQGVQRDDVEAYKWYCLAAAQGSTPGGNNRDNLARWLRPEQIREGQRRAAAFVPRRSREN